MKKIIFIVVSLFITTPSLCAIGDYNHKIGVATDYWKYEEPGIMQDSGALIGAEYETRNIVYTALYYQLNAEILAGRTHYEGSALSNGAPLAFTQTNTVGMLQFYVGTVIHNTSQTVTVVPKIGLLYRSLVDKDDEFLGDYQRDQNYTALPMGIDIVFDLSNGAELTVGGLFTAYFSGENKTYFTDVGGDQDLQFKQKNGKGAQLVGTYAQSWWYASLVIRTWAVEDSDNKTASVPGINNGAPTAFLEPENKTFSVGARWGWRF